MMHGRRWGHRGSTVLLLAGILVGCGGDASIDFAELVVRDSAGITIAESHAPRSEEASTWRLAEEPALHIGDGAEGDPSLQFARIHGVHRLADGTIAVVDGWTPALSFYAPDGEMVARFARTGDGPGELPQPSGTSGIRGSFTCGTDTLYVVLQQGIAAYTSSGAHVRTFHLEPRAAVQGCSGERIIASRGHTAWREEPGIHTDSILLVDYGPDGVERSVLDSLPSQERAYSAHPGGRTGFFPLLFGRNLSVAVGDGVLATGFGDGFEVEFRSADGAPSRIVRLEGRERPLSDVDIERFRDFAFNPWRGNDEELERLEALLAQARSRPLPAYAEFRFDPEGNLWAREYDHLDAVAFFDMSSMIPSFPRATRHEPARWVGVAQDGSYLGELSIPRDFEVHEFGEAGVLGVWRDAFDVEYVREYPIERPPG